MSEHPESTREERFAVGGGAAWPEWVILGFVVVSIVLLLVIPRWTTERNERLRDRMDQLAEPAHEHVIEVQYHLAREMGALRGYLLTRDPGYFTRQAELVERTSRTMVDLAALTSELGGDVVASFIELRLEVDRWHRITRTGPGPAEDEPLRTAALEQHQYQAALDAAGRLNLALVDATRSLRQDLRAAEERALRYTRLLAVFAVASAGALVWLGARVRRLADAAQRERRQAQDALADTRRLMEARHRLIRGVTHDVKNPLGAADGYAELLEMGLRGPLGSTQLETVRSIRRSIQSALYTIDDLLSLSEVEDARFRLRLEDVRIARLVHDVVDAHRGVAEAAGHPVAIETRGRDAAIRTDPRRVEQILGNLLSNAIKHSGPTGEIRVTVAGSGEEGGVEIHVADQGPGISAAHLERIFDEFERLDSPRPGHGLGLTISRMLARRLGGDLTARSQPGEGSVFTLSLPPAPDRLARAEEGSHGARTAG